MQVAYFFTTANVANEKLENDIVEKCLFVVKKKKTIHFLLLWMSCSVNQRWPLITFNSDLSKLCFFSNVQLPFWHHLELLHHGQTSVLMTGKLKQCEQKINRVLDCLATFYNLPSFGNNLHYLYSMHWLWCKMFSDVCMTHFALILLV